MKKAKVVLLLNAKMVKTFISIDDQVIPAKEIEIGMSFYQDHVIKIRLHAFDFIDENHISDHLMSIIEVEADPFIVAKDFDDFKVKANYQTKNTQADFDE
jgi:hypothetical protein